MLPIASRSKNNALPIASRKDASVALPMNIERRESDGLPNLLSSPGDAVTSSMNCESGTGSASLPLGRDHFEVIELLGAGAFGEVKLAKYKLGGSTDDLYAIKVVEKMALHERKQYLQDGNAMMRAQNERDIGVLSQQWDSPFIINMFASFQTSEKLYYVFEYCPGGDLKSLIDAQPSHCFSERIARFYISEVTLGLVHLHDHDTIHRDVKLENVLVARDGHIKLADFGFAKSCGAEGNRKASFVGQCEFNILMPPEFIRGDACGKEMDCWQLGVMAFVMMSGYWPSRTADPSHWPGTLPGTTSAAALSLCVALLQEDCNDRLGFPLGARMVSPHQFFQGIDWNSVQQKLYPPPYQGEAKRDRTPLRDTQKTGMRDFFRFPRFTFKRKTIFGRIGRAATSMTRSRA